MVKTIHWYERRAKKATNVSIFGVGHSSSSYTDNHKNNCLWLGKAHTEDINNSVSSPEKGGITMVIVIYLLMGKKSISLMGIIKCHL